VLPLAAEEGFEPSTLWVMSSNIYVLHLLAFSDNLDFIRISWVWSLIFFDIDKGLSITIEDK